MRRTNVQPIGEILRDFFEDNPEIYEKIMEVRIERTWPKILGPMAQQYISLMYVRDRILYAYMKSAVLRTELLYCKDKLRDSINKELGSGYLFDLVIR